jgi:hypothetical protein
VHLALDARLVVLFLRRQGFGGAFLHGFTLCASISTKSDARTERLVASSIQVFQRIPAEPAKNL